MARRRCRLLATGYFKTHGPHHRIGVFLHQVAYLHSALLGQAEMTTQRTVTRLLQKCAYSAVESQEMEDPDPALLDNDDDRWDGAIWSPEPPECPHCAPRPCRSRRLITSSRPAMSRAGPRGGGEMTCRPVIPYAQEPGDVLALLYADAPMAAWMAPGKGWWARPRRVDARSANVQWTSGRCPVCGTHCAALVAATTLSPRDEIVVAANPSPEWEDAQWPYEFTFDGGARQIRLALDTPAGRGGPRAPRHCHGCCPLGG